MTASVMFPFRSPPNEPKEVSLQKIIKNKHEAHACTAKHLPQFYQLCLCKEVRTNTYVTICPLSDNQLTHLLFLCLSVTVTPRTFFWQPFKWISWHTPCYFIRQMSASRTFCQRFSTNYRKKNVF